MENNLADQAKQALTSLYHWIVDHQPHFQNDKQPTTISSVASQAAALASSYVESYLHPSHTQQQHPAEHSLYLHYQPPHQHHSTAAASSSPCGPVDQHNADGSSSSCYRNNFDGCSENPIVAFFQSINHPDCTRPSWDPVASFDSFLWNYTPDIRALQERVLGLGGLGGLSEKYNVDPRILALALVLPLVMVLLAACAFMGAGNSSEEGPSRPRYSGQKTDPTLIGGGKGKQKQQQGARRDESKQQQQGTSGSSVSSASSKRGAKNQGGPSDASASQYLLGTNSGVSSWSALLGSKGFRGGEILEYQPLDILASFKDGTKTTENTEKDAMGSVFESMSTLGSEMMKRIPYQHILDQDIAQLLGSDFLDSDNPGDEEGSSGVNLDKSLNKPVHSGDHTKTKTEPEIATQKSSEGTAGSHNLKEPAASDRSVDSVESIRAPGSAKIQPTTHKQKQEKKEQEQDKPEQHIQKQEKNLGRQSGQGPAGPGADDSIRSSQRVASIPPPLRTRNPRPSGSFKDSDRPKGAVQHPTRVSNAATKLSSHQTTGNIGRDFGSKIFGFVQDSQLLRNMDSISGGLLGSAVATVAALASTAEVAAGAIKNNLPDSVTDFTDELRESFDHAMRVQDSSEAEGSNKKAWGVRDAISKIIQDDEDDNIAVTKTHATTSSTSSATPIHKVGTAAPPSTPSKTTAATKTGTVRVSHHSGGPKTPASTPATGFKPHPAEDTSARYAGRVEEIDERLSREAEEKEDKSSSSSGGDPMSEKALSQIDKSLSEELASAMETGHKASYAEVAAAGAGTAPSAHTEHEDEDYYLEDEEDSGEEADNDEEEAGKGGEEEDDGEDTDSFIVTKDAVGPIASSARLQEHQPLPAKGSSLTELKLVHPHDELVRSISSISISSSTTGGSIADDELPPTHSTTTSSDTPNKVHAQEMTVDSHGNKVPVSAEARRDSGYDLLH